MVPGGVRSWGMSDTEQQQSWFHAIDLGQGRVTAGRFDPATPPNYTLFGFFDLIRHIDLSRACCFDIGTMDGLSAFVLAGLGARRVVACDLADRETFRWARAQLGYDRIEYRTPVSAHDLPQHVGDERADLIVMAGVLYHVHDPLSVLVSLRQSLRREGLLIVETIFQPNEPSPQMVFNPCDTSAGHIPHTNVYWRPSKAALHGMLELSGFEVMATRIVNARLTVLARARRPHDLASAYPLIRLAHQRRPHPHYQKAADFAAMQRDSGPEAQVRYDGPRGERLLYRAYYEPTVPHQPRWQAPNASARLLDAVRSGRRYAKLRAAETRRALSCGLATLPGRAITAAKTAYRAPETSKR
jgi:2-polyprenyl-3-methyl-5-hydroxy-6-metoxy-1,4-benzoquinol methylase